VKAVPKVFIRVFRRPEGRAARIAYDLGQLAIGLLVGVVLFDRIVMPRVVRQGWDATVPDVRGASTDEGETLLSAARLRAGQILEVSDPEAPAGHIISQDPPAGSRVRRGRLVHLLVSQGSPVREIPDLAGKTVRSARLDLAQQGLQPGTVLVLPSESVPEGEVIGTHPQRGMAAHRDRSVDLLVSGGQQRALYLMPDLRGIDMADAAGRLRAAGISVETSEASVGRFVSAQSPAPGEPIASGQGAVLN
jgi:eukaryotic-like serine/threonine-protein kinase